MKLKIAATRLLALLVLLTFTVTPLRAQSNLLTNATATTIASPPAAAAPLVHNEPQEPPARQTGASDSDGPFSSALALLIPIVAIVMGCSIPIVIVASFCYFQHRKTKLLHETVRAMVEKGVPIPPEMFAKTGGWQPPNAPGGSPFPGPFSGPCPPRNDLRTGLLMTGLGIGLTIFIGTPGAIVLFLGMAFILVGIFEKKKKQPDQTIKP